MWTFQRAQLRNAGAAASGSGAGGASSGSGNPAGGGGFRAMIGSLDTEERVEAHTLSGLPGDYQMGLGISIVSLWRLTPLSRNTSQLLILLSRVMVLCSLSITACLCMLLNV